jgi:serine phosphatase RsbU (regulator of sigma subunit)/catechol 2,3-dioxygenase-like lactoylglutathione lyase family enzyme
MGSSALPVSERKDPHLRIHAVTVYVRDQDRALQFYLDQLGFSLAFDAKLPHGGRWLAVAPPDGSAVLTLVAPDPDSREHALIGRATQVVFVTDNVVAKYQQWRERGVRFLHTPRLRRVRYQRAAADQQPGEGEPIWGGVFTRFKDVDGNSFALVGFDEVSREVEALRRVTIEKLEIERRATRELEIARQVQARLFPQRLPPLQTLEYAGACIQALQVGGDYYDFLDLGRERVGFVIGDIAGKGIAAALLMANLQANLRSQCAIASDQPERFLQSVNRLFFENTEESAYATLFFAEYDDASRRLRYVNCGHFSPLVLRLDNTIERLDSTGTVLGIFEQWDCEVGECRLDPGDTLALYTDGITESRNDAGDEFGESGLVDALRRHRELPSEALVAAIVREVQKFSPHEQHDDITLIAAKCRGMESQQTILPGFLARGVV